MASASAAAAAAARAVSADAVSLATARARGATFESARAVVSAWGSDRVVSVAEGARARGGARRRLVRRALQVARGVRVRGAVRASARPGRARRSRRGGGGGSALGGRGVGDVGGGADGPHARGGGARTATEASRRAPRGRRRAEDEPRREGRPRARVRRAERGGDGAVRGGHVGGGGRAPRRRRRRARQPFARRRDDGVPAMSSSAPPPARRRRRAWRRTTGTDALRRRAAALVSASLACPVASRDAHAPARAARRRRRAMRRRERAAARAALAATLVEPGGSEKTGKDKNKDADANARAIADPADPFTLPTRCVRILAPRYAAREARVSARVGGGDASVRRGGERGRPRRVLGVGGGGVGLRLFHAAVAPVVGVGPDEDGARPPPATARAGSLRLRRRGCSPSRSPTRGACPRSPPTPTRAAR